MNPSAVTERLAVCSWSLQPRDSGDLVEKLRATGMARTQLALDPLRESPKIWDDIGKIFHENGIAIVSGMVACIGEDYSTLESIRLTGGIAPDHTWEQNLRNFQEEAALAGKMGLKLVTFHAGFFPPDESFPAFAKMLQRLDAVADIFMAHDILLGLETGQEAASELAAVLRKLDHPNIGVNFDPANMIMYDKGDPVKAVKTLAPWICQVHLKDAKRATVPGAWGEEVPLGCGEVDWRAFFAALQEINSNLNLAIERECGTQRIADIRAARAVVERVFA
jgi:sugar phosphate isomerase/epimerase